MNGLLTSIQENVVFLLECLAVAAAIFLAAYAAEKIAAKKQGIDEKIFTTRKTAMIGLFSALAVLLHMLDFPVPFAPGFYKLDFSEIPVLIGSFAFGPAAGVMIEFCKILLKLLFKSTSTAFVGDLANFVVGCSFVLPASVIYSFHKTKKTAIVSCIIATLCMTVFGTAFNAVYLLPRFAQLYGMPLDAIIAMGTQINASITDVTTFVCFAVAPLNFLKGSIVSIVTILVYKKLSPILKKSDFTRRRARA